MNPEQWLSLKWNGGSTMSDRWLNQSKIIQKLGDEPYYPVNDEKNGKLYEEYKKLAEKEENIIFGGRLGEYKYYDMDAVIAAALDMCEKEL